MKEHPEEIKKLVDRFYGISGIMYILGVEQRHSPEELLQTIEDIVPERKEDIMTAAQQLELRGEKRGRQQGMQQEKLHIARNMLSKLHLDMQTVAQQLGEKYEQKDRQKEKLIIAKMMLDAHEPKEKVHQFTGLSWVEIEQLLQEETNQ